VKFAGELVEEFANLPTEVAADPLNWTDTFGMHDLSEAIENTHRKISKGFPDDICFRPDPLRNTSVTLLKSAKLINIIGLHLRDPTRTETGIGEGGCRSSAMEGVPKTNWIQAKMHLAQQLLRNG
jgi:hypothetical protein